MADDTANPLNVPYGYCQCGCGQKTKIAPYNHKGKNWVQGEPVQFVRGHVHRGKRWLDNPGRPNPFQLEDRGHSTPCWIWLGRRDKHGYGWATLDNKKWLAHRWFYEQRYGAIPARLHIDHLCRQPSCVNPDHLEPVTLAENTRRGRTAKLTAEQVREIRLLLPLLTLRELSERFGVSQQAIRSIRDGIQWRDV